MDILTNFSSALLKLILGFDCLEYKNTLFFPKYKYSLFIRSMFVYIDANLCFRTELGTIRMVNETIVGMSWLWLAYGVCVRPLYDELCTSYSVRVHCTTTWSTIEGTGKKARGRKRNRVTSDRSGVFKWRKRGGSRGRETWMEGEI